LKKTRIYILLGEFVYVVLYFALFSKPLYTSGYFIELARALYYIFGIVVGIIILLILNKSYFHWSSMAFWTYSIALIVLIVWIPAIANVLGGGFPSYYYARGYRSFFELPEYFKDVNSGYWDNKPFIWGNLRR